MNDRELLAALDTERHRAQGGDYSDSELARFREQAWDYYLGRRNQSIPALAEYEGVSAVKDSTVHDAVNATIAAIMPSFTSDCPAMFEPVGEGDEEEAELESHAVNKVLMDDNDGYTVLMQAIKSALLLKNGVVKVWTDEREEVETIQREGLEPEDIALQAPDWDEVSTEGAVTTFSRTVTKRHLYVAPVDMTRFSWRRNWPEQTLDNCPFVEETCEYTRSDLIKMGYSRAKVESLDPRAEYDLQSLSPREGKQEAYADAALRDNDIIQVYLTHMHMDGQIWYIVSSCGQILDKQPVEFIPYATGTAVQRLHDFSGESLTEKLTSIQDVKTATLRAYVDNLNTNNHARFIYGPGVDPDDLADSGPNRHIRSENGPDMVNPVPIVDTGPSAQSLLAYMDQVTERRVGATIALQGSESQLLSSQIGSMGADRVLSEQEMVAAQMTRTLGETLVRSLFLLIHRVLRRQYRLPLQVRRAGEWLQVDPTQWPERTRLNVKSGMSAGERNRKVANLSFLIQLNSQLLSAGMPLANPQTLHSLVMDWAKAAELDGAERYFTDPASPEYQQQAQQMSQMQQQQQQMALQMQQLPEQVKLQIAALDDRREREIAALKAELEEAKLTLEGIDNAAQREIEAAGLAVTAQQPQGEPTRN